MAASSSNLGLPLTVAGALSGVVYVESFDEPVQKLRGEVARLLGASSSSSIKLIVGGRNLQDNAKPLREYGVTAQSRVLVTRGAEAGAELNREAERARKLEKLRLAVDRLASRDSRGITDDYAFQIENQAGGQMKLQPEDSKALVMGLALHDCGKKKMEEGDHQSALEVLTSAEEAFSLCNPVLTESIDNVGMLLVDIVWCLWKLQDQRRLSVARDRLERARKALERAHGPNMERARALHGLFCPELTTYVRLECLEGVVAFHTGDYASARRCLHSALAKWKQLQVSDDSLAMMQEMGYSLKESRRALRFSAGDIERSVNFIQEQRKQKEERQARRDCVAEWNHERLKYGKTSSGNYVDMEGVTALTNMGYDRAIAAEALRQHDNRASDALEALLDPIKQGAIALAVVARSMPAAPAAASTSGAAPTAVDASTSDAGAAAAALLIAAVAEQAGVAGGAASGSGSGTAAAAGDATMQDAGGTDAAAKKAEEKKKEEVDPEVSAMEQEVITGVERDPMAHYDIELTEEGELIHTFMSMLTSIGAGCAPAT